MLLISMSSIQQLDQLRPFLPFHHHQGPKTPTCRTARSKPKNKTHRFHPSADPNPQKKGAIGRYDRGSRPYERSKKATNRSISGIAHERSGRTLRTRPSTLRTAPLEPPRSRWSAPRGDEPLVGAARLRLGDLQLLRQLPRSKVPDGSKKDGEKKAGGGGSWIARKNL